MNATPALRRIKRVPAVYVAGYSFIPSRAYRMSEEKLTALVERVLSTKPKAISTRIQSH